MRDRLARYVVGRWLLRATVTSVTGTAAQREIGSAPA
jgi:hypothetical protein